MRDYAELVKALRHCIITIPCNGCPYYSNGNKPSKECSTMNFAAADAIEELLAELEEYKRSDKLAVKTIDSMAGQLASAPRWISVEDEPPKENGRYLVRYKCDVNLGDEETVHEDEIRIMRFFVDDGWRYPIICNDHVRLVNEEVTHWMPLPKPPKGVE